MSLESQESETLSSLPEAPRAKRGPKTHEEKAAMMGLTLEEYQAAGSPPVAEMPTTSQTTHRTRKTTARAITATATAKAEKKLLPLDANDAEKAVKPYRFIARQIIRLLDKVASSVPPKQELDAGEKDEGEFAIAAVMYEEIAVIGARMLLLLWLASVVIPRAIKALSQYQESRKPKSILDTVREQQKLNDAATKEQQVTM